MYYDLNALIKEKVVHDLGKTDLNEVLSKVTEVSQELSMYPVYVIFYLFTEKKKYSKTSNTEVLESIRKESKEDLMEIIKSNTIFRMIDEDYFSFSGYITEDYILNFSVKNSLKGLFHSKVVNNFTLDPFSSNNLILTCKTENLVLYVSNGYEIELTGNKFNLKDSNIILSYDKTVEIFEEFYKETEKKMKELDLQSGNSLIECLKEIYSLTLLGSGKTKRITITPTNEGVEVVIKNYKNEEIAVLNLTPDGHILKSLKSKEEYLVTNNKELNKVFIPFFRKVSDV